MKFLSLAVSLVVSGVPAMAQTEANDTTLTHELQEITIQAPKVLIIFAIIN